MNIYFENALDLMLLGERATTERLQPSALPAGLSGFQAAHEVFSNPITINNRLAHFSRIELALRGRLISIESAKLLADDAHRFFALDIVQEYFGDSRRTRIAARLRSRFGHFLADDRHALVELHHQAEFARLFAAVVSLDEVIRTSPTVGALAQSLESEWWSSREETKVKRSIIERFDLVELGTAYCRTETDNQSLAIFGAFEFISLLQDIVDVVNLGEELGLRRRIVDHYAYWFTFLRVRLRARLNLNIRRLELTSDTAGKLLGLSRDELHRVCDSMPNIVRVAWLVTSSKGQRSHT